MAFQRRSIKRLSLPMYMQLSIKLNNYSFFPRENYQTIKPIFYKEGWYYDRIQKYSWYEACLPDGTYDAFDYKWPKGDVEYFLDHLELTDIKQLTQEELLKIQQVLEIDLPVIYTEKLARLADKNQHLNTLKDARRRSRQRMVRFLETRRKENRQ
jgi:hypothetical protein